MLVIMSGILARALRALFYGLRSCAGGYRLSIQSNRCKGGFLKVEYADISLLGAREENQDRVTAAVAEHAALLLVVDGMGGHADGARAAEVTQRVLLESFWHTPQPLFDPLGFLHMTLGRAHEEVVRIGTHLPLEQRPRATCAVCLVQQRSAWWAHVGDSRVYHMRHGALIARTRDHSHVELLLREGLITVEQVQMHPMRNFVESCLGGDPILPEMSITARQEIESGDVFLACTDGLWGALKDTEMADRLEAPGAGLREALLALGELSIARGGAGSDNTSAAALRWLGD
jgi:PPM family protein phosphatase